MRARQTDGQYTFKLPRVCVCGHTFGEHAAVRAKNSDGSVNQPCFHEGADFCPCEAFKLDRKKRS
jgi:hypothetical protein